MTKPVIATSSIEQIQEITQLNAKLDQVLTKKYNSADFDKKNQSYSRYKWQAMNDAIKGKLDTFNNNPGIFIDIKIYFQKKTELAAAMFPNVTAAAEEKIPLLIDSNYELTETNPRAIEGCLPEKAPEITEIGKYLPRLHRLLHIGDKATRTFLKEGGWWGLLRKLEIRHLSNIFTHQLVLNFIVEVNSSSRQYPEFYAAIIFIIDACFDSENKLKIIGYLHDADLVDEQALEDSRQIYEYVASISVYKKDCAADNTPGITTPAAKCFAFLDKYLFHTDKNWQQLLEDKCVAEKDVSDYDDWHPKALMKSRVACQFVEAMMHCQVEDLNRLEERFGFVPQLFDWAAFTIHDYSGNFCTSDSEVINTLKWLSERHVDLSTCNEKGLSFIELWKDRPAVVLAARQFPSLKSTFEELKQQSSSLVREVLRSSSPPPPQRQSQLSVVATAFSNLKMK